MGSVRVELPLGGGCRFPALYTTVWRLLGCPNRCWLEYINISTTTYAINAKATGSHMLAPMCHNLSLILHRFFRHRTIVVSHACACTSSSIPAHASSVPGSHDTFTSLSTRAFGPRAGRPRPPERRLRRGIFVAFTIALLVDLVACVDLRRVCFVLAMAWCRECRRTPLPDICWTDGLRRSLYEFGS
jgi:hypothetical protein